MIQHSNLQTHVITYIWANIEIIWQRTTYIINLLLIFIDRVKRAKERVARAEEYQSRKRSSCEKATSSSSPSSAVQDELLDTGDTTCDMSDDSDPDTTLSEWNTRKLNQKPDKITLQIPR